MVEARSLSRKFIKLNKYCVDVDHHVLFLYFLSPYSLFKFRRQYNHNFSDLYKRDLLINSPNEIKQFRLIKKLCPILQYSCSD